METWLKEYLDVKESKEENKEDDYAYTMTLINDHVQEGVLNDIRNGVNPKSKKLFFHISLDGELNGKTLKPRIPTYLIEKGSFSDTYEEDATIPRVCLSPSIEGCLNAIVSVQRNLDISGKTIYVYIPEKPISEYKIKTNKEIIKEKLVFDATTTGEMWILEPVKMKLYGVITVDSVESIKEKKTVSGIPHGRFDYKWHWTVTPKVIERTYSRYKDFGDNKTVKEQYDMDDVKYTIDLGAMMNTASIVDDVVQEGMFEAGFNNLRYKLVQALGDRYKITNIMKGMGGVANKFIVSLVDDPNKKADVISVGSGVKIPGKFTNISLSQAFDKLMDFFSSPEFLMESFGINKFTDDFIAEAKTDDGNDPEKLTVDDSEDDNISIDTFGTDDSDIHNDYDSEDIDDLNKLISDEQEAINGYFDAAKRTNVEVLRRLYSDIGDEERFHTEQLLFAKASLTGEKYEPSDPAVKREYQELLEMGMDEETAMTTAIDKHGLRLDTEDDEDLKDLEKDMEVVESAIASYVNSSEMLDVICEHAESFTTDLLEYQYDVFLETFCMEAVDNVARRPFVDNPITLIVNGFKALIKLMQQLMRKIQQFVDRIRVSSKRRNQWIKTHGIASLFKSGISMYFYDDKNLTAMSTEPLRYAELMHNMTVAIAQNVGITHIKPFDGSTQGYRWETIRVNSVEEGCEIIKGVVLTKQKIVVTEQNKDMLAEIFFGYNDSKFSNGKSINLYHVFELVMERIKTTCEFDVQLIEVLNNMSSNPNSVYYKDRQLYEQAVSSMKVVKRGFDVFIKAVAHDMNVIMKLNNGLLEQTQMKDNNANQQNVNNNNGVNGPIPMRFNN